MAGNPLPGAMNVFTVSTRISAFIALAPFPIADFRQAVRRQVLILGLSGTFAVIGVLLAAAAIALLFARKAQSAAGARRTDPRDRRAALPL